MAEHMRETLARCQRLATEHECVAVGFSGGKDSLAVTELAAQHFKRVHLFYFYFVPGLESEESKLAMARERWGLPVHRYPGVAALQALAAGIFCDERPEFAKLANVTKRSLYDWIKADTGATLIIDGEKKADGHFRRRSIANRKGLMADVYHPIADWLKWEVLSFLKSRKIPIPNSGSGDNGAISLLDSEIIHLHKHWPKDYETLRGFFPYIETVILRERWFPRAS